ncbi:type IV pilin-like G/H family protein [Alkalinema pantanalense CENA528]
MLVIYFVLVNNNCPSSICLNPVLRNHQWANARIHQINQTQQYLLLTDKKLISSFEREKCFQQDWLYILVCQTVDLESAFPRAFSYAFSRKENLKSYVGGVFIEGKINGKKTVETIICEAETPGTQSIDRPIDGKTCGSGSVKVNGVVIP